MDVAPVAVAAGVDARVPAPAQDLAGSEDLADGDRDLVEVEVAEVAAPEGASVSSNKANLWRNYTPWRRASNLHESKGGKGTDRSETLPLTASIPIFL